MTYPEILGATEEQSGEGYPIRQSWQHEGGYAGYGQSAACNQAASLDDAEKHPHTFRHTKQPLRRSCVKDKLSP